MRPTILNVCISWQEKVIGLNIQYNGERYYLSHIGQDNTTKDLCGLGSFYIGRWYKVVISSVSLEFTIYVHMGRLQSIDRSIG